MAIFRKTQPVEQKPFKCLCEDLKADGFNMHIIEYFSADYNGFKLKEYYGTWQIQHDSDNRYANGIEIFYCPFCGRQLNHYSWMAQKRRENFEKHIKGAENESN